jgi:hypothetical protein
MRCLSLKEDNHKRSFKTIHKKGDLYPCCETEYNGFLLPKNTAKNSGWRAT